jgi:hypothetical protein
MVVRFVTNSCYYQDQPSDENQTHILHFTKSKPTKFMCRMSARRLVSRYTTKTLDHHRFYTRYKMYYLETLRSRSDVFTLMLTSCLEFFKIKRLSLELNVLRRMPFQVGCWKVKCTRKTPVVRGFMGHYIVMLYKKILYLHMF